MKILIAIDEKPFAEAIVEFLAQHAWASGTEFKILHVTRDMDNLLPAVAGSFISEFIEEQERRGRSLCIDTALKLQNALVGSTVKIEHLVQPGSPKEIILKMAESWPADMIVMGSHSSTALTRFFLGSVSMSVLAHAQCSVAIVKLPQLEKSRQDQVSALKQATPAVK